MSNNKSNNKSNSEPSEVLEIGNKFNKNLELTWNGIYQEVHLFKRHTLGKILTIIDAVIVDNKQNKSVKDLINKVVWENDCLDSNMANWLIWLRNQNEECDSDYPMRYEGIPAVSLINYKK